MTCLDAAASWPLGCAPMTTARDRDEVETRRAAIARDLAEAVTLDALTRDFTIFQRRRGHRHSTDDLLTAWYAVEHAPRAVSRLLDLGTGIGSVGLAVAWRFPSATLLAIEVQALSHRLLCENVWANGVEARVRAVHGDLRDAALAPEHDLVTGSPPYFDVKAGIVSADPQRAGARFELCGDVSDYCRAARDALAPGGRFVFCFPTTQRARAERACADAELLVVASRDVVPRDGLPPLFSLFACRRGGGGDTSGSCTVEPPLIVRDRAGIHTPEMTAVRASFGMC